jgi:hypothetical protein
MRIPIRRAWLLNDLDETEIMAGYFAGFYGEPEPTEAGYSFAYWHGWRNGMVDSGRCENDSAQVELAHDTTTNKQEVSR